MTDREKFEAWYKENKAGPFDFTTKRLCWEAWQAALASQQPSDDGWLHWNGERALPPVESMQRVQVKLRNGDVREHYAQNFAWRNAPTKRGVDIIAYRVVKP